MSDLRWRTGSDLRSFISPGMATTGGLSIIEDYGVVANETPLDTSEVQRDSA